jgi:hypothetical protein
LKHEHHHEGAGVERKLHDPVEDKLTPVHPLDLSKVRTINDLVTAMGNSRAR